MTETEKQSHRFLGLNMHNNAMQSFRGMEMVLGKEMIDQNNAVACQQ